MIYRFVFQSRAKNAPELFVDVPGETQKAALNMLRGSIGSGRILRIEEVEEETEDKPRRGRPRNA